MNSFSNQSEESSLFWWRTVAHLITHSCTAPVEITDEAKRTSSSSETRDIILRRLNSSPLLSPPFTFPLPVETASLVSEALEGAHGVGACAEDEDQRGGGGHVVIQIGQISWRVFHKLLPQADDHKLGCCENHLDGKRGDVTEQRGQQGRKMNPKKGIGLEKGPSLGGVILVYVSEFFCT